MRAIAIALLLTMSSGCWMTRLTKPEPVQVPVYQQIECLDRALSACAGVPKQSYATRKLLSKGLGHALRKLMDCQDKHAELLSCVKAHNDKAKK